MKNPYMPTDEAGKEKFLNNLSVKAPVYNGKYRLDDATLQYLIDAAANFSYYANFQNVMAAYAKKVTKYKNELMFNNTLAISLPPAMPVFGPPPTPVAPGIFKVVASICKGIKSHILYTEADGIDMGLEGTERIVDLATVQPKLKLSLANGGHVKVSSPKNGMSGTELQIDHGDGTFSSTNYITTSSFTDLSVLPAAGVTKLLKYRGIYFLNGVRVGMWSDVVNITVTG